MEELIAKLGEGEVTQELLAELVKQVGIDEDSSALQAQAEAYAKKAWEAGFDALSVVLAMDKQDWEAVGAARGHAMMLERACKVGEAGEEEYGALKSPLSFSSGGAASEAASAVSGVVMAATRAATRETAMEIKRGTQMDTNNGGIAELLRCAYTV